MSSWYRDLFSKAGAAWNNAGLRLRDVRSPAPKDGIRLLADLQLYAPRLRYIAYALLSVGVAYAAVLALQYFLPPALFLINIQNVGIIFIIACAFAAGRYGLLPGLTASVAASLTLNYYFIDPYDRITIISVTDALNMALFMVAAVLTSLVTSSTRRRAQQAHQRELFTRALFTLHRAVAHAHSRGQALEELQRILESMLERDVAFFLPAEPEATVLDAAVPKNPDLTEQDWLTLNECWRRKNSAPPPLPRGKAWVFESMMAPGGPVGMMGVRARNTRQSDPWLRQLFPAIADQSAAVLEHIDLERGMEEKRISEEREKLRSMLLSSVSHDLKTPLATIIGALGMSRGMAEKIAPEKRSELLEVALEEAQRLDRHITNILDMTRLESGVIKFNMQWQEIPDILQRVARRLQQRLRHHKLTIHPCPKGIEVWMDVTLTEQVLQNLLDNACKYTVHGTLIEIGCRAEEDGFFCDVRDHGQGLPEARIAEVFNKYTRLQKQDTQVAGTGLGLAIARAMMQGQGGAITVANHPEGGVVFTLRFEKWRPMPAVEDKKPRRKLA